MRTFFQKALFFVFLSSLAIPSLHAWDTAHTTRQPWRPIQESVHDTVVQIFSQIAERDLLQLYRAPDQYTARGSGFFIKNECSDLKDDLLIVTNAHVVDQAIAIWIQIPSLGKRFIEAEVVSLCPDRDVALLRIKAEDLDLVLDVLGEIPYLTLGDSDTIRRSDEVLALGYPLGQESLKSSTGVVSGREQNLIQISAAINPGNSGGPLLNIEGKVIGVNSAGILEAQNVGYAIPINDLKVVLPDLCRVKLLRKPFLGILSINATDSLTKYLGNPEPGGCYVVEVVKRSPLDKAGVKSGDMLYEINGHRLDIYGEMNVPWSEDKVSIIDYISRLAIGEEVHLVLYRRGERKEIVVTFDHSEVLPIRRIYPGYETIDYEVFGGMVVAELTLNHVKELIKHAPGLSKYTEMKNQTEPALIVTHIFPNSLLYKSRTLTAGVTLKEVNNVSVKTMDDFRKSLKKGLETGYFVIRACDTITRSSDNVLVVLPFDKIMYEQLSLSQDYHFPLSDTVQELLAQAQKGSF